MDLRLYGTVQDSIVDGPGLRYAVFVQGCPHACPGCHNPDSQPAEGGEVHSVQEVLADIRQNPLVQGVTLSGGSSRRTRAPNWPKRSRRRATASGRTRAACSRT